MREFWFFTALCSLLAVATSVSAEPTQMRDTEGRIWWQDGPVTCVQLSPTTAVCGRTQLPPDPGTNMTVRPLTHDCFRPSANDSWSCQPKDWVRNQQDLQNLQNLHLQNLQNLQNLQGYADALAAGGCIGVNGTWDPVNRICHRPPPPAPPAPAPPIRCFTSGGNGWGYVTRCE